MIVLQMKLVGLAQEDLLPQRILAYKFQQLFVEMGSSTKKDVMMETQQMEMDVPLYVK